MEKISEKIDKLSPLQRAVLSLEHMQSKLNMLERSKDEPIAIIGMSCRFPGGGDNPEAFWKLLRDGVDAITEVPSARWEIDTYYDSAPAIPGKMYTRSGGFLQGVDQFDPEFFGISPREAISIDPQQRLLLEVSWEALENAGQIRDRLSNSQTGVFIGITTNDYTRLLMQSDDLSHINAYFSTGNALNAAAGRLSYTLGLQGPSMAIDTACSSSLVAIHLACQSLRNFECDQSIAGGVNLILAPEVSVALCQARMLSLNGRCKTFDTAADGYVRGEGCGIIVLKRLTDAIADGDNILALIRGSAVNQDGPSSGFTVPNQTAQQTLIRKALAMAKVEPSEINYVEAHGTGTSLGDPIEVRALGNLLGEGRSRSQPLMISSVKTNIGHLEAAAGIAGLIKVVLALQHQEIPPHLHLHQPNPYINWDKLPVVVPTERTPWSAGSKRRIAGVSSFGASGTNAHIVLEEAPASKPVTAVVKCPKHLLTLSAKTEPALVQLINRYQNYLAANPSLPFGDICFTANTGRRHFPNRLSVVASSCAEAGKKLAALSIGQDATDIFPGQVKGTSQPKIAFLFTDQGSQYVEMGRQLYETASVFRQTLDQCDRILQPYLGESLLKVLYPKQGETSPLDQTAYAQPALFAIEYALFQLWKSWGVEPTAVLGHGLGEYVAATVAGVFSLEDGLKLIAARVQLMQTLPPTGEMAMEPLLAEYHHLASTVTYNAPQIDIISNLTGERLTAETIHPEYCHHLGSSVQFAKSMQTLHACGCEIFLELGPKPTLLDMGRKCLSDSKQLWLPSLHPNQEDWQQMLASLAQLYVHGLSVDWSGFHQDYPRRSVPLPTYPFQRQRYWVDSDKVNHHTTQLPSKNATKSPLLHPLLGQKLHQAGSSEIRFESQISKEIPTFFKDHQIYQMVIVPATAYLEMALAAGTVVFKSDNLVVEDTTIEQALVLPEDDSKTIQLVLNSLENSVYSFQIFSLNIGKDNLEVTWTLHATGKVRLAEKQPEPSQVELASLQAQYTQEVSVSQHYQLFRECGIDYGPGFQAVEQIWRDQGKALSRLQLPEEVNLEKYIYYLHPVLLDASFQALGNILPNDSQQDAYLPVNIARLEIYRRPSTMLWSQVKIIETQGSHKELFTANVSLFDTHGSVVAQVEGLTVRRTSRKNMQRMLQKEDLGNWLYQITWQPQPREPKQSLVGLKKHKNWLIFADRSGIGVRLADQLRAQGDRCVLVFFGEIYQQLEEEQYQVNPLSLLDFQRLLRDIFVEEQLPNLGVVHLWSFEETQENGTSLNTLQKALNLGCGSVLYLVQALASVKGSKLPHLWLVTKGVQSVENELSSLQVQQAPLWGLGRVIASEHPELQCVCLDLEPSIEQNKEITTLQTELCSPDRENQIAYRQGVRYVARLVRSQSKQIRKVLVEKPEMAMRADGLSQHLIRSDSSYLITGALGALGLKVADWMVKQGARHLILNGRRNPTQEVWQKISQWEKNGVKILVVQADIAHQEDVARVLETIQGSMPPLRGVFHAAGVLDDGVLLQQTWQRFTRVMAPKVQGAWNLHILTQNLPLDFFVCFSSVASLLGSPGQGNYAAANAFMDILAHHRQRLGLPGLSINWGAWAEAGMATIVDNRNQGRWLEQGISFIAQEQGLQVLENLLGQGLPQVGVLPVNWSKFLGQWREHANPALFLELAQHIQQHEKVEKLPTEFLKLQLQLREASPANRHSLLIVYFQEHVAKVLGVSKPQLDVQMPLDNMGLDSLMALDLRNQVKTDLDVDIPMVKFMEGLSVASLVEYVSEQLVDARSTANVSIPTLPTLSKNEHKAAQSHLSKGVNTNNDAWLRRTAISDINWIEGTI